MYEGTPSATELERYEKVIKPQLEAALKEASDEELSRYVAGGSELATKERERRIAEPTVSIPVCTSGDIRGEGETREKCIGGKWTPSPTGMIGYGAGAYGMGCTNPTGAEGETTYIGNILNKCVNGQWVEQEFGPAAPGGGTMATEQNLYTQPYAAGSPQWMEEVYGPQAGYMTGLGLFGKQGRSPYQSYQERLYDPLTRLYDLSSQFTAGGVGGYNPGGFMGQWGQPYAENPFAMYAQARGMMGDVMGMAPEQRAGFGLQGPTAALQDLLGMGLRQQIGLPGASWLSGRLPQEQESWVAQYPQQGAGAPNFMDYLREKYNLGQYF